MNDRFKFICDLPNRRIGNSKQTYKFAMFECPYCKQLFEIRKSLGCKQICCKSCYGKYRTGKHYGSRVEKVFVSGYYYIWMPNHPFATKKGYIAEHRLVVEKHLGRYLEYYEDVHHVNGNKIDNRLENLIVLSHSDHMKLHTNKKKRNLKNGMFEIQIPGVG